jgi:hypothetical protein
MLQTGSIHGAKTGSYNSMNDPIYPGPGGKMFTWERNALCCTSPRSKQAPEICLQAHLDLGSGILDLPPSYKTAVAKIITTPDKDTFGSSRRWASPLTPR